MTGVLHDSALVAAPTYRSRAYVQAMRSAGLEPARAYLLPGEEPQWKGPERFEVDLRGAGQMTRFRVTEPVTETLEHMGVECLSLASADINAAETVRALTDAPEKILIYSGRGGALLRPPVLQTGKRFLHVHGGWVPDFRGSTAFYFSLLKEGRMGASALWLDEGIDTGTVIRRRKYPAPSGVDIDCIADPLIRADLLVEVLSNLLTEGRLEGEDASALGTGTTYHVIHPVLKNIALRRHGLIEE